MKEFQHAMGDTVRLVASNATGVIIGRAEYTHANPSYFVRHVDGQGDQVERWYDGEAIE